MTVVVLGCHDAARLAHVIEARPYGPDASSEELAAIRARVRWLEDDIIEYRELPVMTPFSVNFMFDAMRQLVGDRERYAVLVDITETQRPNAELREQIRKRAAEERDRVRHVAVVAGKLLLVVAVPFVYAKLEFASMSMHSNREDAIEALRHGRR